MASNTQNMLPFGEWRPDLNSITSPYSSIMQNVYPRGDGYGPFPSFAAFTQALPANCRGFFFARKTDGTIAVFAGTSNQLLLLNNTTFQWGNVSLGGGSSTYTPLLAAYNWHFVQFNDYVIAVQGAIYPQKFILTGGTSFVLLGGSPPQAAFVSIIGFFVVLSGLTSYQRRLQWSDLGGPETWTAGTGQADYQDMSDGGSVVNCAGGDAYGVVFQQESIRTLTYAPGSSTVFALARVSTEESLYANDSIINVGDRVFYIAGSGFKMIQSSSPPVAIGKDRVDRTFFSLVDTSNLQLVVGASDPNSTRVYWGFKSNAGQAGLIDTVFMYDYDPQINKWTVLTGLTLQWLGNLAKPGLTLEQMDALAPTQLPVTGAAASPTSNGAAGYYIRLALSGGLSNANFAIAGQNFIVVQGITGTTEANGPWTFTVIDTTHVDLLVNQNTGAVSAFTNAYISGGAIGGSVDAITYSFDNISTAALTQLAAVGSSGMLGFFTGANLEAIMETSDGDPKANTIEINGARPITDSTVGYVSIGGRLAPSAAVVYSGEYAIDDQGWAEAYVETRYARGRLRIPSGTVWTYAGGIEPDVSIAGEA